MNLKQLTYAVALGTATFFCITKNGSDQPVVSAVVAGPPTEDKTIYLNCKDEVRMFEIFPGPQDFPEVDTDIVNINLPPCVALNLTNGITFNGLCAEGIFKSQIGNSCNHAVTPKVYCVMQDSTENGTKLEFTTKHGTVFDNFMVRYVLPLSNTQSNPQNMPNLPKQLVAKLLDENGNLLSRKVVNLLTNYPVDTTWWVVFDFGIYLDPNKSFTLLIFGRDKLYNDPSNVPLWDFAELKGTFLCSALGNFCQWGPAKKVWEETYNCTKIMYYQWTSSCGDVYVVKYVLTDYDAPVVLNKPKDVTITLPTNGCEMEYFVPSLHIDDCDKNPTVFITSPYGDIRGNGGILSGIRVDIKKFPITYMVTDACGNYTSCTYNVYVKEANDFTLVCKGATVVSLNDSCSFVSAKTFVVGTTGLCCRDYTVYGMRMDNQKGGKDLKFCCSDVGKKVMVMLTAISDCDTMVRNSCMVEVEVQNKMAPRITCPIDLTISCDTFDISNLSKYGKAVATASCGVSVKDTFVDQRTMCNTGEVIRTFTATGSNSMIVQCSQTITVIDTKKFDESNIVWPRDTVFWDCHANYGPDRGLYPKFDHVGCSKQIAWSYIDEVFNFRKNGKCKSILRTWKVIDWCNFNPKTGPYWTHLQIIEVMDSVKPVITSCPKDTAIGNLGACTDSVLVNLESVTAIDCGGVMRITNDSKYAFSNGANATGRYPSYPIGVHKITYTVYDSCGSTSTCSMTITVSDKKPPTPNCLYGLSFPLQKMSGGYIQMLDARLLNNHSFDNCTKEKDLKISFSQDTNFKIMTFDCSNVGENIVEIWYTDEQGNQAFCKVNLLITDNLGLCPPTFKDTLMVAGALTRPNGSMVEYVKMTLDSTSMICSGSYKFDSLAPKNHKVIPFKDDDPLFGVSTRDIVKIQRYVLNKDTLTPYQMIAADVNRSGSVTASDISEIRKLILGINSRFQNNNSWRFVPQSFVFPSGSMTWNFPEIISVNYGPIQDVMNADFIGIKIGDVDGSANNFSGDDDKLSSRSSEEEIEKEYQRNQAIIDAMELEIALYPNPTSGVVFIDLPKGIENAKVSIISSEGLETRTFPVKTGNKLEVSLEKYPSGVYIISVTTDVKKYQAKVLRL